MARQLIAGSPRKRIVIVIVAVLVIIVVAAGIWLLTKPAAAAVRTAKASLGTVQQSVSASGAIAPAQTANLTFAVSGQVNAVQATVGERVTAGQPLATLTSATLPSQVAQANAAVANDNAKVAADQSASSTQLAADQAALAAAQDQLDSARQAESEATLSSPITGTVAAVNLTVGQQVSGGGSSGAASSADASTSTSTDSSAGAAASGTGGKSGSSSATTSSGSTATTASSAQVVVISTGPYVVSANVDDTEVSQITAGEQALITPDGATKPVFGTVSSVGLVAAQSSGVATYPVSIAVTGSPAGLFAGAAAQVQVITKQASDVLTVPSGAVHQENGHSVVYQIGQDGKQVSHPVTVGMSSGGKTQITSGLTEGAQFVEPQRTATRSTSGGSAGRSGLGGFGGGGGAGGGGRGTGGAGGFGG